jgi:hypothetical protein
MQISDLYTPNKILQNIVRLNTASIERLKADLETILEERKAVEKQEDEAKLVQRIEEYTNSETYERYKKLSNQLRAENITATEHQELLALTQIVEAENVERLEHLMTLAKVRKMSLRAVMTELGLIVETATDEYHG